MKLLVFATFFTLGFLLQNQAPPNPLTRENVANAERLIGMDFSDAKRDTMLDGLKEQLDNYQNLRKVALSNRIPPALQFNPIPAGMKFETERRPFEMSMLPSVSRPADIEELAFSSVGQLA